MLILRGHATTLSSILLSLSRSGQINKWLNMQDVLHDLSDTILWRFSKILESGDLASTIWHYHVSHLVKNLVKWDLKNLKKDLTWSYKYIGKNLVRKILGVVICNQVRTYKNHGIILGKNNSCHDILGILALPCKIWSRSCDRFLIGLPMV